jgi:hypothetical protein
VSFIPYSGLLHTSPGLLHCRLRYGASSSLGFQVGVYVYKTQLIYCLFNIFTYNICVLNHICNGASSSVGLQVGVCTIKPNSNTMLYVVCLFNIFTYQHTNIQHMCLLYAICHTIYRHVRFSDNKVVPVAVFVCTVYIPFLLSEMLQLSGKCVLVCVCECVCMCMSVCMCVYVGVCVCMCVCTVYIPFLLSEMLQLSGKCVLVCVCGCVCVCMCMSVCMCVYVCVCVCVCVCVHSLHPLPAV